jgi:hypothetical protein
MKENLADNSKDSIMHFKIDKEIKSSYADKISMFAPV